MIKIVTDTGADLPRDLASEYNVSVLPGYVTIGSKVYRDGVDFSLDEFYQHLENADSYMSFSEPTEQDFEALYRSHLTNAPGSPLISLHSSSRLTGVFATAQKAAESIANAPIHPTETYQLTVGCGLIVLESARMAAMGNSFADIQYRIAQMREGVRTYLLLDTMDFVVRAGRVPRPVQLITDSLGIKVLLTIEDGKVIPHSRYRGRQRAIDALFDLVEKLRGPRNLQIAVSHADCEPEGKLVYERLVTSIKPWFSYFNAMGTAGGGVLGPGAIAVSVWSPSH